MSKEEKLQLVVDAGVKMRALQKQYFKTRTPEALVASKNQEKLFDTLAAELATPGLF